MNDIKKQFNPKELDIRSKYHLMISGISPRPIAFVTSICKNNNVNLAPYSFFNGFGANPPIVGFSPALSGRTGLPKDTLLNIKETEEFTISIADSKMVGQVSLSSCEFDKNTDEYEMTGLTKQKSKLVKSPYVKESPFAMECKLYDIIELGNKAASGNLILGEIVMFHISENILDEKNSVDPYKLDAISRLGGSWYSKSKAGLFEYNKPKHNGIGFNSLPENILKSKLITANELSQLASIEKIPMINHNLINENQNKSISELENLFKKLIEKRKFNDAWSIASIINKIL